MPDSTSTPAPPRRIGVREFRGNMADVLRQARAGASFLVTSRDEVLAVIGPPPAAERPRRSAGRPAWPYLDGARFRRDAPRDHCRDGGGGRSDAGRPPARFVGEGRVKLLLDTHALLWWLDDDAALGRVAHDAIADPTNEVLVSVASF